MQRNIPGMKSTLEGLRGSVTNCCPCAAVPSSLFALARMAAACPSSLGPCSIFSADPFLSALPSRPESRALFLVFLSSLILHRHLSVMLCQTLPLPSGHGAQGRKEK